VSVRRRKWKVKSTGETKTGWVLDYRDKNGVRRLESFKHKKTADARAAQVAVDLTAGVHVARRASITVAEAAQNWVSHCEANGRERSTVVQYRGHAANYIGPRLGRVRLCDLTAPDVVQFDRDLHKAKVSKAMRRKIIVSLSSLLKQAMFDGYVNRNVAAGYRVHADKRGKVPLRVGEHIPTKQEIRRFLAVPAPNNVYTVLLLMAVYCGMRASELRGLPWSCINFKTSRVFVRQRADLYNQIGRPKSSAGERTIPIGPKFAQILREWKQRCPPSHHDLVFPSSTGGILSLTNIRRRGMIPLMEAAGVTKKDGTAKYSGLHALRHFHASWLINPKNRGGLELPPKVVQRRLGHSSLNMTMDTYGHLFEDRDGTNEMARAELELMAT